MQMERQTEILLESGTNEFEIMEFTIAGETFGINVAKVLEIMMVCPVKPMQKAQQDIEGIFKSRDMVITVIDLASYLGLPPSTNPERDIFIITNFNNTNFAFHVHSVVGIARISWQQIKKPDKIIYGGEEGVATGIADFENHLITILDFEKIVSEISPELGIQYDDLKRLGPRSHSDKPILVAEDSPLLNKLIVECLRKAGYENLTHTENGRQAYDIITSCKSHGTLHDRVQVIISDIEMPEMDGHRLTKLVKTDEATAHIPVILFSSLVNDEMRRKGEALGADAQLSKPEIGNLVKIIDQLVAERGLGM